MINIRSNFNPVSVGDIFIFKFLVIYWKLNENRISNTNSKKLNQNTSCSYGLIQILSKTGNKTKNHKF